MDHGLAELATDREATLPQIGTGVLIQGLGMNELQGVGEA
jgi:hypothetical protein